MEHTAACVVKDIKFIPGLSVQRKKHLVSWCHCKALVAIFVFVITIIGGLLLEFGK